LPYRKEPEKFLTEIAKHYATDRKYTRAMLSIMKAHHLEQYDTQ
jgi:flagellum-specific peptidoglycan hydrolase FlgJ